GGVEFRTGKAKQLDRVCTLKQKHARLVQTSGPAGRIDAVRDLDLDGRNVWIVYVVTDRDRVAAGEHVRRLGTDDKNLSDPRRRRRLSGFAGCARERTTHKQQTKAEQQGREVDSCAFEGGARCPFVENRWTFHSWSSF